MMMGVAAPCARSRRHTSYPSIVGSTTSSRIRSGCQAKARSSPLAPSETASASWPSKIKLSTSTRAMAASSSTTRILGMGVVLGMHREVQTEYTAAIRPVGGFHSTLVRFDHVFD